LELSTRTKEKDTIQAVGAVLLVQLLKKYLDKAIAVILACDQVAELNNLPNWGFFARRFDVEVESGIAAIGGVEAVVKIMKASQAKRYR
jgi:hypothetical protein